MSATERDRDRASARCGRLLSLPAPAILMVGAILPLLVMVVCSFLTPGEFGNVV